MASIGGHKANVEAGASVAATIQVLKLTRYTRTLLRGLAGLAGAALLAFAAWGVLFISLVGGIAVQAPDPFVEDGDPCCGHPDTLEEVAAGVAWTLGYVIVDKLLVCLAIGLLGWAARGRWPRARRLAYVPAGGLVLAVAVPAVILVPQLDEGRTRPDCATFAFSRSEF